MLLSNEDIKKIIPHRYPFLLVDKIESIDEETKTIVGIKCVSANEMQFLGHFPQQSVMPGVLIVEAMAQTGAVYLLKEEENRGKIPLFAGINKMRFSSVVVPGDVLRMKVQFKRMIGGICIAGCEAYVDDKKVAYGEILCALHPYKIARRILSEQEYEQFSNYSSNRQKEFLAGRFAAREAIIKALPIPLKLKEIVVEPPKEIQYQGYTIQVSIAHDGGFAMATALVQRKESHENI